MTSLGSIRHEVSPRPIGVRNEARLPLVWIVDDSPIQAAFTERALGAGYRYERFLDGLSAIERLSSPTQVPALILLDWVMPSLSGDEVCRYLRSVSQSREIPIVILTASRTQTEDIVCALESGANDYVVKPFVPAELHARIGTILRAAELKCIAERERRRVTALNELARCLFEAGSDIDKVLTEMARWIAVSLGDGCAVSLMQDDGAPQTVARHRAGGDPGLAAPMTLAPMLESFATADQARQILPEIFDGYIAAVGLRAIVVRALPCRYLATGIVVVTRDGASEPFDADDLLDLQTCLEFTGLAIEAALRSEMERNTTRFHEQMLGIVGHDLRNPLSALGVGHGLLREDLTKSATASVIDRLDRSVVRMTKMLDQLLDVTRARLGTGIALTLGPTSLSSVIAAVLDEQRLAHAGTPFELVGSALDGDWDSDRLEQVIANLASNAAHYGRPGATVRVELAMVDGAAHVVVHNEIRGAPIPEELLQTLFDPFKRGRGNGQANARGLGLGLYIVHQIVRAHAGTIAVESSDAGTTFRIVLPLSSPARVEHAPS